MQLKHLFLLPLILIIFILFPGCSEPSTKTEITIVSPSWTNSDGWKKFYTNDSDYYNYSFTSHYTSTNNGNPVEVQMQKVSGSADHGYGVIFAIQKSDADANNKSMYRFLVSVSEGYYNLGQYDSTGNYTAISSGSTDSWKYSAAINTGYEEINTVNINFVSGTNTYSIKINNTLVDTFSHADPEVTVDLTGGKSGFYVSVGDETEEDFPNNPVDVRFKMITPISIP